MPSNAPLPIRVSVTGASTFLTKSASSLSASAITAPPPTSIIGFSDFLNILIASSIAVSSIFSVILGISFGISFSYSATSLVAFLTMSTSTGPGRPVFAISKALLSVGARSFTSFTIKLYFVIGVVTPAISISWKESFPRSEIPTLQVIATIGTESIYAVAIPVTRFVAPGPLVAIQTPTFPVERAYPSAAWEAPCSCDVRTCLISS